MIRAGGSSGSACRSIASSSRSVAMRPFSSCGCAIVVSGGVARAAAGVSSKPTSDNSAGTETPSSTAAWRAPIARTSLIARTAVGGSGWRRSSDAALRADSAPRLDRLELLERLAAALAPAERAAWRRSEDVLEPRLGRVAVRAAERLRLQLNERRRAGGARRRRGEARLAELLAARRGDAVGRPRVVRDHRHL